MVMSMPISSVSRNSTAASERRPYSAAHCHSNSTGTCHQLRHVPQYTPHDVTLTMQTCSVYHLPLARQQRPLALSGFLLNARLCVPQAAASSQTANSRSFRQHADAVLFVSLSVTTGLRATRRIFMGAKIFILFFLKTNGKSSLLKKEKVLFLVL